MEEETMAQYFYDGHQTKTSYQDSYGILHYLRQQIFSLDNIYELTFLKNLDGYGYYKFLQNDS